MNAGTSQYVGRYTDFSPRLVLDTLPLAVFCGDQDEGLFEGFDIDVVTVVHVGEAAIEITLLLDQVCLLEWIGRGELGVDLVASLDERLGAHLPTATRPVLIERHEIATDGIPLAPTLGKRILVLVAQGGLGLGLSFTGGHTTSVAAFNTKCNSRHSRQRVQRTVVIGSPHENANRREP